MSEFREKKEMATFSHLLRSWRTHWVGYDCMIVEVIDRRLAAGTVDW